MPFPAATGLIAYLAIAGAAVVEGEIVYIGACALASQGRLSAVGVAIAGAVGATIGDQIYFYVFRGRLERWLHRLPAVARRGPKLARQVRQHESLTVFSIRFSPGLRVALIAACAYAAVPALKFTLLNALSSLVWAVALMAVVAWFGPAVLTRVGLSGWWGALVPAVLLIVLFRWRARHYKDDDIDRPASGRNTGP